MSVVPPAIPTVLTTVVEPLVTAVEAAAATTTAAASAAAAALVRRGGSTGAPRPELGAVFTKKHVPGPFAARNAKRRAAAAGKRAQAAGGESPIGGVDQDWAQFDTTSASVADNGVTATGDGTSKATRRSGGRSGRGGEGGEK